MKVELGLDSLTYDELADFGEHVHAGLTSNAVTLPVPHPTIAALAAGTTALRHAVAVRRAAESAAATAVENRRAAAAAERALLSQEGSYVENRAGGDAAIIALANMGVRAERAPVGAMPKVQDLRTTISHRAGEVDWMCKPVEGSSAYIVQTCTGDPAVLANWHYADTAIKSSGRLKELASGKIYLRVAAHGTDENPGAWSDLAEEVVR